MAFTYEYEEENSQYRIYDDSGAELNHSPVPTEDPRVIPRDLLPAIAEEIRLEFGQNGFTDRVLRLVVILADTEQIKPK